MRWFFRALGLGILAWLIYILSPYVALYDLARAARDKDVATIEARVDFPALRLSLARQIAASYLKLTGGAQPSSPTLQFGTAAGAAVVEPLIEPYLTVEAIMRLLTQGWGDGQGAAAGAEAASPAVPPLAIDPSTMVSLDGVKRLFFATEWRGFRSFLLVLPVGGSAEPLRVIFRLGQGPSGLAWRLVGLEIPDRLRDSLARQIAKHSPRPSAG